MAWIAGILVIVLLLGTLAAIIIISNRTAKREGFHKKGEYSLGAGGWN